MSPDIRVVDTDEEFDALEAVWNSLSDRCPAAFFASFDFVRLAWKHSRGPNDRLLVLVLSDGGVAQAIAPFCVVRWTDWGIPHRVVRYIAAWEGDRPGILAACDGEFAWNHIVDFLMRRCREWDVLELMEQPGDGPGGRGWSFLKRRGNGVTVIPDAVNYYLALEGTWDDYLNGIGGSTRRDFRRYRKRLDEAHGPVLMTWWSDPQGVKAGLSRYLSVEAAGWKPAAGLGAAKDERHLAFLWELMERLALKGRARVYVLTARGTDIAAAISYLQHDVEYGRHTAYLPSYRAFSPGVLLHAEVFKTALEAGMREMDLLSMPEDGGSPIHKSAWATGKRQTVRVTVHKPFGRLMPLWAARSLYRWVGRRRRSAGTTAGQTQESP
jgi:CelD/BcsL family acetyltransferase involved in cellulose biosynthesis